MLTANAAKIFFTNVKYYPAQAPLVKMRTSVALAKLKMRCAVKRNTVVYDLAVTEFKRFVSFKGTVINVYLPADATAMLAFIRDAFKLIIIFRCV
jgi:hypothetical protein